VHQRRRGDQGLAVGTGIGNRELRATLRHGRVDREDAGFEARQDLIVDPPAQDRALRRVRRAISRAPSSISRIEIADRKKLAAGIAPAQAMTLRSAFSGRRSSEATLVSSRNISRDRPAGRNP
jgi:hypothetical protein